MVLNALIFECAEAHSLFTPAQKDSYHPFFQSPFPILPTPQDSMQFYSINVRSPKHLIGISEIWLPS